LPASNSKEITILIGGLRMSCYECGSNKLEIEESYTGKWFICCKECEWAEIYELYKADNEPENYRGD
jgi:hypothetical protein